MTVIQHWPMVWIIVDILSMYELYMANIRDSRAVPRMHAVGPDQSPYMGSKSLRLTK